MAQYPIPQFIESEGKIISFLTFRQFFVLVGAGAICGAAYYTLPFALFAIISLIVAVMAFAIAFLKIDNTSVVTLVVNFLSFTTKSKNYVWQKKDSPYPFATKNQLSNQDVTPGSLQQTGKMVELRKK